MTDYTKQLESQNLELREENEYLKSLLFESNTKREVWHIDELESHKEDSHTMLNPVTYIYFSADQCFSVFRKKALKAFNTCWKEKERYTLTVKTSIVYANIGQIEVLPWIRLHVERGKLLPITHRFQSDVDDKHPAYSKLIELAEDLREDGMAVRKNFLMPKHVVLGDSQ